MSDEPSFLEEFSQGSSSFQDIYDSEDCSVEDMLLHPVTFRLFSTAEPTLVKFFVEHVEKLLKLSFSEDKPEIAARAFAILEHALPEVTLAMLDHQRFNNVACGVLAKSHAGSLFLSRLSSLTLSALLIDPGYVQNSCGFILQLISYLDSPSVFALFEALCGDNKEFTEVQRWLVDIGFMQLLTKEIDTSPILPKATWMDTQANLIVSYYSLIKICATSPVLRTEVTQSQVLSALNHNVNESAQFIEDARWEAIASLKCGRTRDILRVLFQTSIELLIDPKRAPTRAGIAAIDILAYQVTKDPLLFPFISSMNVTTLVSGLVMQFPEHSILHQSAIRFLVRAIRNPKTMRQALDDIAPLIVSGLRLGVPTLHATAMELLTELSAAEKDDDRIFEAMNEIPGFVREVKDPFSEYSDLLCREYGGSLPFFASDPASQIAMMANKMNRAW